MEDAKSPEENTTPEEEKLDRRDITRRMGKFLAYTAPALIALATAKDASAN
jgi:hypothetical protein